VKVTIGYSVVDEVFLSSLLLKFENGLVLKTSVNLVWAGCDDKRRILREFEDVVDALEASGHEIAGREKLNALKKAEAP
jgi:hypothetical protein